MKKGILFDLDGTLWDATQAVTAAYNRAIAELPCRTKPVTRDAVAATQGLQTQDILPLLFHDDTPDMRERLSERSGAYRTEAMNEHPPFLFPDVQKTLGELRARGYFIGLVTNSRNPAYVAGFLDRPGVRALFDDTEDARTGLPKAQNIRRLMERNHLDAAVYVGDTEWDRQAAVGAGIPFLHAAYGFGKPAVPTPAIAAFADLPQAVEGLL